MLRGLLALFSAITGNDDPQCACCVRNLFPGHICPESVVIAREARALVRGVREIR